MKGSTTAARGELGGLESAGWECISEALKKKCEDTLLRGGVEGESISDWAFTEVFKKLSDGILVDCRGRLPDWGANLIPPPKTPPLPILLAAAPGKWAL